mmetsp:Transcript_7690/g.21400  ORF Transcript_7690/g.21400 Transcript_7690/m.21400 type:complete len:532 (-) Transcript_7690:50-1645(-)|eukprot:CAMPEP_0168740452 /NCGR_PEP_ID=MMETSP0724-20121128/11992_1 /TAXON_ID=265536 /ORGANISM="Amphiprora sp., Strain CCMP467" /LENGTH=531 /DNA_ID=CAMNT_0008787899 /DNA_START=83 /DNA_END=1678 /DNA_ORIENTATION=-
MVPSRRSSIPPAFSAVGLLLWVLLSISSLSTFVVAEPSSTAATGRKKGLTLDTMHQGLKNMEYAVRGAVVIEADQIKADLKSPGGAERHGFDHVVYTNIGNPHSVGGKPLTWPRQVMALVDLPDELGVNHAAAEKLFPADAIARAKEMKQQMENYGTGAYTHSKGIKAFREHVAEFISQRDGGIPSNPEDIFLTNGASAGIAMILNALISHNKCGILIPIPQYPLYSATIDLLQGQRVGYYLDEKNGWALNVQELERAYRDATSKGVDVRALVVINPGNPSGSVLTRGNLHDVVKFCSKHNLLILADEVYQENVYGENMEFISCKRAAYETGLLDDDALELVSFHSTSKGVFGECGRRGGYMEIVGLDQGVKDELYKLASAFLCSSTNGQIMTSLMVRGPHASDASYKSHEEEKKAVFESLKRRSQLVSDGLNSIPGFSCQKATGSMYCFPKLLLPDKAIAAAKAEGVAPDTLYAVSLLQETGICVVPASGFGQESGRFGFRTTFLPSEEEMAIAVEKIRQHYELFCQEYE